MSSTAPPPRYARQTVMKEIGAAGQAALGRSVAVILGLGALGSNSANLLARAGVGTLRLVDRDIVDWTNLQRQSLYDEDDIGQSLPKAAAATRRLRAINSTLRYEPLDDDVNTRTVEKLITGATVVVDGLDSFHTRALVNQACVKHGIPFVYGACLGTYGATATILPGVSACLNCLLPDIDQASTPPLTCETVGVLGPVAALVAACQTAEAMKVMVGARDAVSTRLMHADIWRGDVSLLPMRRDPHCSVCGTRQFDLLEQRERMATASLCGRNAVQVLPTDGFELDFDLLGQTLGRLFPIERNAYLLKFRASDHDLVVFPDGRAMVFGTADPKLALSLYGKYVGG